ncbi:MAG: DUF1223 domain-containing protein [Rhizobiaceae bacterium]
MTRLLAAALLLLGSSGLLAAGEQGKSRPLAVVELFTSQGCTSCPPADAILAELAQTGDVVALAYHVDYWDYLGWRDTLANADNTARQYEYSNAFGSRSVYTPQAVVNGRQHVNGADRAALDEAIGSASRTDALPVDVELSYRGDTVVIETGAGHVPGGEAHVMLIYFNPATEVEITLGRNKGRSFTFWNSVSRFHSAGVWHGKEARYEMPISEIAKKGAGGCAVIIQAMSRDGLPGAILGAAIMNKPGAYR